VAVGLFFSGRSEAQTTAPPETTSITPGHAVLLTGYGSVAWRAVRRDTTTPNDFLAGVSPILLFQASDRLLFTAEIEFGLEEGVTETDLEYAQVVYNLSNNLKVGAGKILLPFNGFTEIQHPSWINRFVSPPPLYGGHDGDNGGPAAPLVPILTDVGVQLRAAYDVGEYGFLTLVGYVTQGPRTELATAEEAHVEDEPSEVPEVVIGQNFEDNNTDKLVGGRVGVGLAPFLEADFSVMSGRYDDANDLRFTALGMYLQGRYRDLELQGEWIRTAQDVPARTDTSIRSGYYGQVGYHYGKWRPLVRWGQIYDGHFDGDVSVPGGRQLGFGLVYAHTSYMLIKAEYLLNREDADIRNDRFAVQWAFGF